MMMNIKSNSCKLFLILSIFLATNTIKADGPRIVITYPLSGMHTRSESVLIEGKVDGFKPSQVLISLDQSTILTQKVNCTDGHFQLEVKLGAGKTNISASAKPDGMQLVETGFYIFRDCTVTNIIGQTDLYVNSDKRELTNLFKIENGRTLVPLREVAQYFGANIGWNAEKKACTITIGRRVSTIALGSKKATVAGVSVDCDPPAKVIDGTFYVSSRMFSKTIGGGVAWDAYSKTLSIAVP